MKEFLFGKLLSLYSPDVTDYVQLRQPKSAVELVNLIQDYRDTRTYWKDRKYSGQQNYGKDKQQYVNRDDSKLADGRQLKQVDPRYKTHNSRPNRVGGGKSDGGPTASFVPTCFNCGKVGHKRPD